ncbi:MAG: PEP-CTERM sorting domain-containing protein [Akkermansiaceae bacterium]|nr:PEP-CTERM sorting domain-containing protein [Akkermansiaceae bacterium]
MKKTLVILLAAASSVFAAETSAFFNDTLTNQSLTSGNASIYWDTNEVESTLSSWTLTFTITSFSEGGHDILYTVYDATGATSSLVVYVDSSYALTLATATGNVTTGLSVISADTVTAAAGTEYTLSYDAATATASLSDSTSTYSVQVTSEDIVTTLTSGTPRVWTSSRKIQVSLGTVSDTAAVPEPATATLGLLALGALALRRRRA